MRVAEENILENYLQEEANLMSESLRFVIGTICIWDSCINSTIPDNIKLRIMSGLERSAKHGREFLPSREFNVIGWR